jgi:hypothetical protein
VSGSVSKVKSLVEKTVHLILINVFHKLPATVKNGNLALISGFTGADNIGDAFTALAEYF